MSATTCPFCNALVTAAAAGQGPCPRCGEEIAFDAAAPAAPPAPTPYRKPIEANRVVGLTVFAVMLTMAGIGLWYALITVGTRRAHDTNLPRRSRRPALPPLVGPSPATPVVPGRLSALGYLPPGTSLVAAVHVADLLESPVGERLKGVPLKVGPAELSLDALEQWVGVPAGNIDHLAVGSVLEPGGTPTLTPATVIVIRTRQPVGVNRLREALAAGAAREQRTPEGGKRSVASGRVKDVPLSLWLPNANTVVIGLFTDLADVPGTPADDNARVVSETRGPMEERLAAGTVAWAAGSAADAKGSPILALVPLPEGVSLDGVRALAVGVPRETPLRVQAAVRFADAATAAKRAGQVKGDVKAAAEGEWLTVQWSR